MKKTARISALILSAVMLVSGCGAGTAQTAAGQTASAPETTAAAETTTAATTAATASETTAATTTTAAQTTTVSETAAPDNSQSAPEKLFIKDFISSHEAYKADKIISVRDEFMENNVFIDFDMINEPEYLPVPDDVQQKIRSAVMSSTYYRSAKDDIEMLAADENTKDFVKDGEPDVSYDRMYEYDYDGDGHKESFIFCRFPQTVSDNSAIMVTLVFFRSRDGFVTLIDSFDSLDRVNMFDYGRFRQLEFGGMGYFGEREHYAIYGVCDGIYRKLFDDRIWSYEKMGCCLAYQGWQGYSGLMVYDTRKRVYRQIYGYPLNIEKLKEYDPDDIVKVYGDEPGKDSGLYLYYCFGEKYILDRGDLSCAKYENGKIVPCTPDEVIQLYPFNPQPDDDWEWFDIDIDAANAKALTPAQAADVTYESVPVPESANGYPDKLYTSDFIVSDEAGKADRIDRERLDFTNGNDFSRFRVTDLPASPEISENKMSWGRQCLMYKYGNSVRDNLEVFRANEATKSAVSEDGFLDPQFITGIEDDFDGDGRTECFLFFGVPQYSMGIAYMMTAVVYCNRTCEKINNAVLIETLDSLDFVKLYDYGGFKQIVFGGHGLVGLEDKSLIYGVQFEKSKCLFSARDGFEERGALVRYLGFGGASGYIIYDDVRGEYREVTGYPADYEKLSQYDPDGLLMENMPEDYAANVSQSYIFYCIGERYIFCTESHSCFKYENGKIIPCPADEALFIYPLNYDAGDDAYWFDIDIESVIS